MTNRENKRKDFTRQAIAYLDMTGNPEYAIAVRKTLNKCDKLEKRVDELEGAIIRICREVEETGVE